MGLRPVLLLDALQSLALQHAGCLPVVIVHGGAATYAAVRQLCRDSAAAGSVVILHAPETLRRRGYPINVGLEYCLTQCPEVEFIFFLDDDDIVYPFFTSTMAAAFCASAADVVYAASNRRVPGQPAVPGYAPQPIHRLLRANFITSNSFAIRAARLRDSGLRMNEELEYTEDWDFLIRMLQAGFRFHALLAALSEFRIVSDGNLGGLADKRDPAAWRAISIDIRRYINASFFPLPGPDLVRTGAPSDTPRLQEPLAEKEGQFTGASARLREKTSEAEHLERLLEESRRKEEEARNAVKMKSAEADELRLRAQELASSIRVLRELLASEQAAHLLDNRELGALKAKLSRLPLRLLVR